MALQLGFGDSVKLIDGEEDSIREVLTLTADRYRSYTDAISVGESPKATYWRIAFAILSVHSPLDATFEAYKAVRLFRARFSRLPSEQKLTSLLGMAHGSDGVIQYPHQKALYLREFDKTFASDPQRYLRNGDSDSEWRFRLQQNTKGLGLAKASFAVALASPATSDVCCIDTHMYQLFTGRVPHSSVPKRLYLELEAKIRAYGREFGLSTFATQWCLWDAKRGVSNPHSVLGTL